MSDLQKLYIILNENNIKQFFDCLRKLLEGLQRNVQTHISEESMEVLRKLAKKKSKIGKESQLRKVTFKVDEEFIDIIYDDKNDVVEISFGPYNQKRKSFMPYKRKTTIQLNIILETEVIQMGGS